MSGNTKLLLRSAGRFFLAGFFVFFASCSKGPEEEPDTPPENEPGLPQVRTAGVADVTDEGATVSCVLVSDGGKILLERGVVYGLEENPTLETGTKVNANRGTGEYSVELGNLSDWKGYHVRAFATNKLGTSYGEDMAFETLPKKVRTINLDGVVFKMVYVEGGTFRMGAADDDASAESYEKPAHNVTLDSYYIGSCEVTNEVWNMVMEGRAPTPLEQNDRFKPVGQKSWTLCQEFVEKLNGQTGMNFSLPTEAQWEYAARGGNKQEHYLYCGSDELDEVGWYYANAQSNVMIVGTKKPNGLGLYDMTGNVLEWCADWYGQYTAQDQVNPVYDVKNPDGFRVMRGGSVVNDPGWCRLTHRFGGKFDSNMYFVGFRLVLNKNKQEQA